MKKIYDTKNKWDGFNIVSSIFKFEMDPQTVHALKHLKVVKDPIYGLITQFVSIEIAIYNWNFGP
jgi:hypothetical protein